MSELYIFGGALALFFTWRWARARTVRAHLKGWLAEGAQLVDVRTPAEFAAGHVPGSVNLPVSCVAAESAKLRKDKKVLVFCASGARSAAAAAVLKAQGFQDVVNAGSWRDLL